MIEASLFLHSPGPSTIRGIPAGLTQAWIALSFAHAAPLVSKAPRTNITVLTAYNLIRARTCSPNPFISIPQTTIFVSLTDISAIYGWFLERVM